MQGSWRWVTHNSLLRYGTTAHLIMHACDVLQFASMQAFMPVVFISPNLMQDIHVDAAAMSDEELCRILDEHLKVDARPSFATAVVAPIVQQRPAVTSGKACLDLLCHA